MISSNKLKLNKILCILALCAFMALLFTSCGEETLSEQDYFSALQKTDDATVVNQVITITDSDVVVSEVNIQIKTQNNKVQVKTIKKVLNSDLSGNDYIETEEIVYFYNNEKYYKTNENIWVKEQGNYESSIQKFDIKEDDLKNIEFENAKKAENILTATIIDSALKDIFGESFNGKNCNIEITLNKNAKLLSVGLNYLSSTNKSVNMKTSYDYIECVVDLPQIG